MPITNSDSDNKLSRNKYNTNGDSDNSSAYKNDHWTRHFSINLQYHQKLEVTNFFLYYWAHWRIQDLFYRWIRW